MQAASTPKQSFCETAGQILSDGRVIDLGRSGAGAPTLIIYDGHGVEMLPTVEYQNTIYRPPSLDPSVCGALRLPSVVAQSVQVLGLFRDLAQIGCDHLGLPYQAACVLAFFILCSWLRERIAVLPIICLVGCSRGIGMKALRLLSALCCRGLVVGDLSLHLPLGLRPTLLIADACLSKKARATWSACSYPGIYLPFTAGKLITPQCPIIVFSEDIETAQQWGDNVIRISLLPIEGLPPLSEHKLNEIASQFQPALEMMRLQGLYKQTSPAGPCPADFAGDEVGRQFWGLFHDEPEIPQLLLPVTEFQREAKAARRSVDLSAVILECIWGPAHTDGRIAVSEVQKRVNALLFGRGESVVYSNKEIGWKLREMALERNRTAEGMELKFSHDLRSRVHSLARQFGLNLPKLHGCDCSPGEVPHGQDKTV